MIYQECIILFKKLNQENKSAKDMLKILQKLNKEYEYKPEESSYAFKVLQSIQELAELNKGVWVALDQAKYKYLSDKAYIYDVGENPDENNFLGIFPGERFTTGINPSHITDWGFEEE